MKKVIIIGAGPAGLTAAYEFLTRTDIRPVIIEMDNQVGGLSKTIRYKGNLIDIGGHRFFSKSQKITDWWLQFLPLADTGIKNTVISYQNQVSMLHSMAGNPASGQMLIRPRKSRIYYNQSFFDYPLSLNKQTIRNFGIRKITQIGLSYLRSRLFPIKEEKTLDQFFINRFGNNLYRTFFKGYTEKIWGISCDQIPADWGRQRIKDLDIGKAIIDALKSVFTSDQSIHQRAKSTSLIEQFLYPEKGPGQMWETVADRIIAMGGEIYLEHQVDSIHKEEGKIVSIQSTDIHSGKKINFSGDYYFSTMPIQNLVESMGEKNVPAEVASISSKLAYRDFMIVGLLFKKDPGRKKNRIDHLTDNWIYLQDSNLIAGRLQIFNNWSPKMVADPDSIWIGLEYFCSDKDAIWGKPESEMVSLALREIRQTGLIQDEQLLDSTVIKVPKAYPSYIGAYDQFQTVQNFLDGIENLYLTGRNGMHRYNNTDHSMMTAMTAVDNIISNRKDRSNIWAVNMEDDFHETISSPA